MIAEIRQKEKAALLFAGWEETMIWSCLQGIMGHVYGDDGDAPVSAMALLGDFCFFTGKPCRELVQYKPGHCRQDFVIMVPRDENWAGMIEECFPSTGNYPLAKKVARYAIRKEPDIFRGEILERLKTAVAALPEEYELKMMDEKLFLRCGKIPWCRDWVSQYEDYELYREYGLGVVILKDGEPVSGASSYSGYRGGIEIEIDTREDYRRKGLACVCGAKLILECRKRGWYPSWDAQNPWSVALAEKLGYHFDHAYTAYEVYGW